MSPASSRGQPDPQLASAQQSATLAALRGRGHVKAVQMADEFGVTHETIRKDRMLLESHKLLRRVHGGAMPVESLSFEPSLNKWTTMATEKKRIATAAADLLPRVVRCCSIRAQQRRPSPPTCPASHRWSRSPTRCRLRSS
jgi:DeoR family fructose operon transcriptional repressor